MVYLLITSLLWAFSFGLIKGGLEGIPSPVVTLLRLAVALAVFAPFVRLTGIRRRDQLRLAMIGAVQYGLMYLFYIEAFRYLKAYEIALFTVFTPFYVAAIHDLLECRIHWRTLAACVLAVAGGVIIQYRELSSAVLHRGFLLMQASNLCFAAGQILYRRTMGRLPRHVRNLDVFALLYLGATLTAAVVAIQTNWTTISITPQQAGILLYLGAIAAGLGFFLWNAGARQVRPGTLAVFNNLKIPLAILVSVLVFRERADWARLLAGGSLMLLGLLANTGFKNRADE